MAPPKKPKPMITPKKTDLVSFEFTEQELIEGLQNPHWRLTNLYRIIDANKNVIIFRPNVAQRYLLQRLHTRQTILKSRKRGFSTVIHLLMLDTALFSSNESGRVIAQDLGIAEAIFRDTLKFSYDGLPAPLKTALPMEGDASKTRIEFRNGSSVEVSTNARGTTPTFLHVSEFGKIAAKDPGKSREIITGSITAVSQTGLIFVESTAEGQGGDLYDMVQVAIKNQQSGKQLFPLEFRFFFYGWWQNPVNIYPPEAVVVPARDHEYFDTMETQIGQALTPEQRAWYVSFRENTYMGDQERMWQEQPSCVAGDTLIGTPKGIIPIRDAVVDGKVILDHMHKGVRPVFAVKTQLGYTVICTDDHPIKTPSGEFKKIKDGLTVGDSISLAAPMLSNEQQYVVWNPVPFVEGRIHITPEFAEFIGVFMGNGSFYNGAVSVSANSRDQDAIQVIQGMFEKFLGGQGTRVLGKTGGCTDVRKSSNGYIEPLLALGAIEKRAGGVGLKRKVHVPPYIMRS